MSENNYPEAKLWDMIEDIRVAMLTTKRGELLESRPMSAYVDLSEHCLWFITALDSGKTDEIGEGEAVNLAFVDKDDQNYISLTGHARVVRDVAKQKQLWNAFAEAWMPEGPEGPNVGLIRVDPIEATYWDAPSSRVVMAWKIAKANVTQTPPNAGEVRKVGLG
ncbi:pyridoxamine 5'-phosphate oxidase family protein [Sphingoaurantiacus capsulatus]|uniref:Pyridoxamine 5'-phosphate oxidase family protein n=1 Tax=Sphingoaurantiacus capsulatus TaxID=1771310 RepID=A0ABV7XCE5_9SPHN